MQLTCISPTIASLPMELILDIRDVSYAYRGGGGGAALERISLSVRAGSVVGVIGPNGGGKTTLLKLILGLLEPTQGTITIDGQPPTRATRAGLVGYLPQSPLLARHVPIDTRQLVELGLAGRVGMLQPLAASDRAFADELLDAVGLTDKAHAPISELSGGQLQRALIARALVGRPRLLLLDEPTLGIDRRGQQSFIELILKLKASLGLTILFVSHDLRAVSSVSDRIACVSGRIHYHDVPQHLPADVVYELFACDLDAFGIEGGPRAASTAPCVDPGCDGHHAAVASTAVVGANVRADLRADVGAGVRANVGATGR